MTSEGAPCSIVAQVEKELGPVDVLINNAGVSRISPFANEPDDLNVWWRVFEINVRAPAALARAVLPSMLKRNTGVIISTSSAVATLSLPVMSVYTSSKAAISKFHESLAEELSGTGILTFAVHPGTVQSGLATSDSAVNMEHIQHPAVQGLLGMMSDPNSKLQEPQLCADTMVALVADPRYKVLTGRHINSTQELHSVAEEAEKEGKGRLGKDRLYLITVPTL